MQDHDSRFDANQATATLVLPRPEIDTVALPSFMASRAKGAVLPHATVLALQRTAGNRAVAGLLSVQRLENVFSDEHFSNPVAYLNTRKPAGSARILEEPGSQGIVGVPDRRAIAILANETSRQQLLDKINDGIDRQYRISERSTDAQKRKNATDAVASLTSLREKMQTVYDRQSAAIFYRQNTLALSKLGALPMVTRQPGAGAGAYEYVFHSDSRFIKVSPAALSGDANVKQAKATALNGPFKARGWVRGHHSIDNMKHRFIEHLHVNKGKDDAIDIYKGTKEDGAAAEAWKNQQGVLLTPTGPDVRAVENAISAQDDQDLANV